MFLSAPFGFGGGRGASLGGVPNSVVAGVVDNIPPYRDCYAYLTFDSDGTAAATRSVVSGGSQDQSFTWFPQSAGIGNFYWLRFTALEGSPNYGVAPGATLYQLNTSRTIGLAVPGGQQGRVTTKLKFELFSSAAGGTPLDTTTCELEVEFSF